MAIVMERLDTAARPRTSITAEDYTAAIREHAKPTDRRTLYPGHVYEDLSEYLDGAPLSTRLTKSEHGATERPQNHATLYALDSTESQPTSYYDSSACVCDLQANLAKKVPQLLFLRGYSCSSWLNKVGTTLSTDPEFLNSNLIFRCRETYACYPALPSAFEDIVRLRFFTIGSRGSPRIGRPKPQGIQQAKARRAMERYSIDLLSHDVRCGDSIVRDYRVLGEDHFVIEQEVSICLHSDRTSWTALVCSDIGTCLSQSLRGPWLSDFDIRSAPVSSTTFYPTIQHRKKAAFRTKKVDCADDEEFDQNFPQTASLLALDYGQHLDKRAMALDPFYALHDLFAFEASSQNQVLNLIEDYVSQETSTESLTDENPDLSNLVYYQELLDKYIRRLKDITEVVRRRGSPHWPRVSAQEKAAYAKVELAADVLLRNFQYLHDRATSLSRRCERGMSVIMNNQSIAESKKVISQAQKLERLTLIAFVYIPLSFTTSFFGMNVTPLGTGTTSLWVWVATSVPLLLLTVMIFYVDFMRLSVTCRQVFRAVPQKMSKMRKTSMV